MNKQKIIVAMLVAGGLVSPMAHATNGYFAHGYGMKAKGMGGAATAMANDTFGGANNPASMVWVGNRIDIGVDLFSPDRSSKRFGSGAGIDGSADSGSNEFLIPEFGYNRMIKPNMSLGLTVYGNGGMNTDYSGGQIAGGACPGFNTTHPAPYNLLCGSGKLGIDMMQLIVAPTLSYKMDEKNSIGISPLLGYQRFKAEGLQGFRQFTTSQTNDHLTNQGYDSSTGYGLRLGWMGNVTNNVTLGAAYSTKMRMGEFDKYSELFAEQGGFDIPENYNFGIAFKASPAVMVALDYQRINYSGINSVGNPSTNGGATIPGTLGTNNGRGFGWGDIDIFKVGVEHQYNNNLVLRAGYNHGDNPIQGRDVTFNIIAPGVVQEHLTLGATWTLQNKGELTIAYAHAFKKSVTGSSLFNSFGVPAGSETIEMKQNSLGIAYSWKM